MGRVDRITVCALLLAAAMLAAGCGGTRDDRGTQTEAAKESKPRIGIVFDSYVIERWERDRDIFTSTAQELGADVLVGNANGDPQEQKKVIQHMIDSKVEVLVIIAIDGSELSGSVDSAHKAGIPVISYDRIIENADTDLYITFDNYKVGEYMAQAINAALPDGGTYMELCGSPTDHNVDMVQEGFDGAIGGSMTMIDTMSCTNWDDTEAFDYLTKHVEDLTGADAFMCGNDSIAGQVVRALAERRLAGKKIVTGQDADLAACQRIVEGTQTVTIYKPIEKLAVQAARVAVEMADGKQPETDETISDGSYEIPYIAISPIAVSEDNLDAVIIQSGFHNREDVYLHVGDAGSTENMENAESTEKTENPESTETE